MTDCIQESLPLPCCEGRRVEAHFSGGDITSNGGVVLLREADRRLGLTERLAKALTDPRRQASCVLDAISIVRQRVYGLALGYDDLNDHDELRRDLALQTAVDRDRVLPSVSALCRFEHRGGRAETIRLHEDLIEQFIASHKRPPKRLVLDFDAPDDRVRGQQVGRFYHGYYAGSRRSSRPTA